MPYMRRDKYNSKPNAQVVYADCETEKMLFEAGFVRASGAPYYNYMGTAVDVIIYEDATWEPNRGTGFLADEWTKMREFAGVQLKDFVAWLKQHYEYIADYCANLNLEDYRKEETFNFTKVYRQEQNEQEYAWLIEHFTLMGSDGVIPADKNAIPRQYWFVNGKYYESMTAFTPTGISKRIFFSQTPDVSREMTDRYVIERIKNAFLKNRTVA